jgi:hypothetical protein
MLSFKIAMPVWNAEHAAATARLTPFPYKPVSAALRELYTRVWEGKAVTVPVALTQVIPQLPSGAGAAANPKIRFPFNIYLEAMTEKEVPI